MRVFWLVLCFCKVIDTTSYVFWWHLSEPLCSSVTGRIGSVGSGCVWGSAGVAQPAKCFIWACTQQRLGLQSLFLLKAIWNKVTLPSLEDQRSLVLLHLKTRFPESKPCAFDNNNKKIQLNFQKSNCNYGWANERAEVSLQLYQTTLYEDYSNLQMLKMMINVSVEWKKRVQLFVQCL